MDLVQVNNDNQIVTSSKDIAEHFEKEHKNVLKSIDGLMAQNLAIKKMFFEVSSEYRGRRLRYFLMNRDGFSLFVMGFTGAKALEWKLKYIAAFNAMEQQLKATAPADALKAKRLEVMKHNAKVRGSVLMGRAGADHREQGLQGNVRSQGSRHPGRQGVACPA